MHEDIKSLRSKFAKSGTTIHNHKPVDPSKGWYAKKLLGESKAGIHQKKKIKPANNIAKSNLMTEVLNKKK